jgi:TPR repeat protein
VGDPKMRIILAKIFLRLNQLLDKQHYQVNLYPDGSLDLDGASKQGSDENSDSQFYIPDVPVKPLEDGIAAHKNKDYKNAWNIFEHHAELGDSAAKYWKAYYLAEGFFVSKDIAQAASLFKEAADDDNNSNNADACFRYAFMMFDSKNSGVKLNRNQFVKYLTQAADGGNPMAQFNLGDMYLNGKLGSSPNVDVGIKYLKLAALNGHPDAVEMLKKKNVDINE